MKLVKSHEEPQVIEGEGLYAHTIYTGKHEIEVEKGDTAWVVFDCSARIIPGPAVVESEQMCVVIRGYQCVGKQAFIDGGDTNLPYINGCSTDQIFHPVRVGDPTLQKLHIPPFATEQKHHIHSTPRIVLVQSGTGDSVIGMQDKDRYRLEPGDVIILNKMEPHHFETADESLTVLPLHIFSSTVLEHNHPMKNGTFEI